MKFQPIGTLLLLGSLSLTGCQEYFNVNEACHDNLVGGSTLDKVEKDAMLRLNCHRRLAGLTRATANELVQKAADGEVRYVQQNPDYSELVSDVGPIAFLTQQYESPGFTGSSVYERLTGEPSTGGAGYTIYDIGGTGFWEFILIDVADDPADLKSGKEAIDELMRLPLFRQSGLQPSWIDGAYSEGDLPEQWFIDGGYTPPVATETSGAPSTPTTTAPAPTAPIVYPVGRVHYMLVVYQAPHFEHVDKPVLYPKEEQTDVPLYSWSQNRDLFVNGAYATTQVGFPVTLTMGAVDPENYEPVDQNQYSAQITGASIVEEGVPLETEVVHPGDDPEEVWPSGQFQRTTLAIFTRHPLQPSTNYKVFIDLVSPAGTFAIDYEFKTAAEDPGVNPDLGLTPVDPTASPERRRTTRYLSSHHTPPVTVFP